MRKLKQTSTVQVTIDQKQLESVECFNYLASTVTRGARCTRGAKCTLGGRCTRGIKSTIVMAKSAFNKNENLLSSKFDINLWRN
jgi:hypothetical protein